MGITLPAMLALRSITQLGAAFDGTMMKVKHVAGFTGSQFKQFTKMQTALSKEIGVPQTVLSKTAYLAAQAQLKTMKELYTFSKAVGKAQKILPGDAPSDKVASGFLSIIKSFYIQAQDFVLTMAEMI
jgi:hypothetical protein